MSQKSSVPQAVSFVSQVLKRDKSKAKAALYSANEPTIFQAWSSGRRSRRYGEFLDTIAHTIQCLD